MKDEYWEESKTKIKWGAAILLLFCLIPVLAYMCNFREGISDDNANWGALGDFIGGLLNPILSFANLVVVIWIARLISRIEGVREDNSIIKLAQPYGIIETDNYENLLSVRITNGGLGPMIIKEIKICNSNTKLESSNLIDHMPNNEHVEWSDWKQNLQDTPIPANCSEKLIELKLEDGLEEHKMEEYANYRDEIRSTLKDISIVVVYTDIYESKNWTKRGGLQQFDMNS